MGTFQIFVAVELEGGAQRALFHAVKHVLDVDEVSPLQPKIDAHAQKLFRQHRHVKAVAVEPAQVASVQPFQQSGCNPAKRRRICHVFVVHPMNQAGLHRDGHLWIDENAMLAPRLFRLFDDGAVRHQFDHGHLHNAIHPHFGSRGFEVKKHQGPLQVQPSNLFHHVSKVRLANGHIHAHILEACRMCIVSDK